jgi:surface protein
MNTKFATFDYLESELLKTLLPEVLIDIIIEYTKTSIKVTYYDGKIRYYSDTQFENIYLKDIIKVDINYGVLILVNPICKFKDSKIRNITGDVILVGDVSGMFANTKDFIGDVSLWDTSKVNNMRNMFCRAKNFNSDLSKWNTSQVTNMRYMFCDAKKFNSDLSKWETENVTDMDYMFFKAKKFNSDLSKWNIKKVTNVDHMFYGAESFNLNILGISTNNDAKFSVDTNVTDNQSDILEQYNEINVDTSN